MSKQKTKGNFEPFASLDFTALKSSILAKAEIPNATPAYLDLLEKWYKRFLYLVAKYPSKKITINNLVDDFWHQHMLDSRSYINDCLKLYGAYLHHDPYFGLGSAEKESALQRAYEATDALMDKEFGETYSKTFLMQLAALRIDTCQVKASYCSSGGKTMFMNLVPSQSVA